MEEWVSPNHKQLSAAYADDDIDFSELDQYLSRGRTSPLPSSTELSNHRPRETSVQYPAEFLSDSFNEAKKRRIGQHMDSPLLHRQKTSSPTNNHILGKASETVGGSSANMDDSTTYATEQVTSPYGEPCNFINGDMDFNPNDYFHFSDYELSSHSHTAHTNLATHDRLTPLPMAGETQIIDKLGHMGDKKAIQQKPIIYKEAPQSSQATRVNSHLDNDPVRPFVASSIETSDRCGTHDVIDNRKILQPLDAMFPLSMGAQINPDFFEIYKYLLAAPGVHLIESSGNAAMTSKSDPSIIGDPINRSGHGQDKDQQNDSPILITSNKIPQETNPSMTIHQRKSHTNLQSSLHLKRKKGLYVPNSTSSTSLHTKGSDVHSNLSHNSIDSLVYKDKPNEMVMGVEEYVIHNLEPQEASKNDHTSFFSSKRTVTCDIPRLEFDISTEIGNPKKLSSIQRNSLWLHKKKIFLNNVSTWYKYWKYQTGCDLEKFSTINLPPEFEEIFSLFVFYAEMIITVLGDPNEDHHEYVKKLKRAIELFEELVNHNSAGNSAENGKNEVGEMKAVLEENIRKGRAPRSEFLWRILQFWIGEERKNLWPNETVGRLNVNDHFKGLFNSIFSFSIENLTESYKSIMRERENLTTTRLKN
ncbi:hypothetical protein PSHT_15798 [Puccinia striiformis]|uniref:Uncharacterized protein n=1 Tax=Puccinia striiformis TaxID=27350 RepID=A0A2S4UD05_9BASI|nr:hypothetical protein PSHT_15798 [Puccinia striiformis]